MRRRTRRSGRRTRARLCPRGHAPGIGHGEHLIRRRAPLHSPAGAEQQSLGGSLLGARRLLPRLGLQPGIHHRHQQHQQRSRRHQQKRPL